MRKPTDPGFSAPNHRHLPPVPPLHRQGGPGVRARRHLQARQAPVRRRLWARGLLRDPLHGYVCQD